MNALTSIRARAQFLEVRIPILIVGAFVVGSVFVGLLALSQIQQQMLNLFIENQESDAIHLAQDIEREVAQRKQSLEQVAAVMAPTLASKDAQALQSFLEARPVFSSQFNRGVFVVGVDGVAIASAPALFNRLGINYADRDYVVGTLQGGQTFIGRPVLGKPLGQPVFVMAAPVRTPQGRVVGALAGVTDLSLPSFFTRLKDFESSGVRQVKVIDARTGLVVASSDLGLLMQATSGYSSVANKVATKESNDRLVTTTPIAANWVLELSSSRNGAFNLIENFLKEISVFVASGISLIALLALWIARLLLRPLRQVSRLLAGWTVYKPPFDSNLTLRVDEVGLLTRSFNDVVEKINLNQESLKKMARLMDEAGNLAKVGGWEFDVRTQKLFWSAQTYRIHELSEEATLSVEDAIQFCMPRSRLIMSQAISRALESGTSLDVEVELVTARGNAIWVRTIGQAVMENGKVVKLTGAIQDITQHKRDTLRINDLAFKDELTDLPNRRLLIDKLEGAIAASQRNGQLCALVAIDIDNFKLLNDSHGHFKGDLLLKAVAHALLEAVRESDTVARVGADEFMVILTQLGTKPEEAAAEAKALAEQLCAKLSRSYTLGRIHHYSTVSIGVVAFGWNDEVPEEPMKRADLALTQAKASGCALTLCFEPQMQVAIERRVALEAAIRRGLIHKEFDLYYQAQVVERGDGDRRIVGAETLIRWRHPEQGMISPAEFIPVAEDSGLILDIGNYVLAAACEQLARWASDPTLNHLTLAVNVSARQFHQAGFVESVLHALAKTNAPAHRLKLELTEGMLVTNIEDVVAKMKTLKTLGVSFSLDDFGTGYSSLSYLKRLPLDQLKIDQSFVREILDDANDAAIARTVIGLADSMGLAIIAEGVETQAQRQFLAGEGCIAYQGFLFSHPVPIEAFEALALTERDVCVFERIA